MCVGEYDPGNNCAEEYLHSTECLGEIGVCTQDPLNPKRIYKLNSCDQSTGAIEYLMFHKEDCSDAPYLNRTLHIPPVCGQVWDVDVLGYCKFKPPTKQITFDFYADKDCSKKIHTVIYNPSKCYPAVAKDPNFWINADCDQGTVVNIGNYTDNACKNPDKEVKIKKGDCAGPFSPWPFGHVDDKNADMYVKMNINCVPK